MIGCFDENQNICKIDNKYWPAEWEIELLQLVFNCAGVSVNKSEYYLLFK